MLRPRCFVPISCLALLLGCAEAPAIANAPAIHSIDDVTRANPAGAEPVAAVEIHRAPRCSLHVVQVTDRIPLHVHAESDEIAVLWRGAGIMQVGDQSTELIPGMAVYVPKGVPHAFRRTSAEVAVAVAVYTPPLRDGDRVLVDR